MPLAFTQEDFFETNMTMDSCLGGLVVMTLAQNARDWG